MQASSSLPIVIWSRKSSVEKAKMQQQAVDAVAALKATAEQAIDRLHQSVPVRTGAAAATPAAPAPAAPAPQSTAIEAKRAQQMRAAIGGSLELRKGYHFAASGHDDGRCIGARFGPVPDVHAIP